MSQRTLDFLSYNEPVKPQQQVNFNHIKLIVNDLSELFGDIDTINRTISLLPTSGGFTAGQDLSGTSTLQTVIGIQTIPVSATPPVLNDILQYDGANWIPTAIAAGGVTNVTATLPIISSGGATPDISTSVNTNILIGRGTAGVGVMEEITLGTNLSLTGTTLNVAATPLTLSATQIGFGSGANLLTGSASLTWDDTNKNFIANGTININLLNSANVFYVAQGDCGIWFTGTASTGLLGHRGFGIDLKTNQIYTMGDAVSGSGNGNYLEIHDTNSTVKISTLAGAGGTVIASATGLLSTIPTTSGTVTSVATSTGLTGGTITSTGTISLNTKLAPADSLTGNALKVLRVNAGETAVEYATPTSGTVTTVSVATANGFSGTVANATTTPAITIIAGAITPTSVNGIAFSGSGSIANTGVTALTAFTGSGTSSGTNTGDQTIAGLSPLTTKGDIFTFSTINTRLAVGATDGMILGVSSAATTGLVWSTPTYPMSRGGTGAILRSDGTNNVYSTSTFADTYSINTLLYNASANTVSGLATANSAVLITSAGGVPSLGTTLPNIAIGTPTSGTLTNCTGLPAASVVAGALANGMTATTQAAYSADAKVATDNYVNNQDFGAWVDYSGTSTIVGWSSFTTQIIKYIYCAGNKTLIVNYNLIGTSNATTASFTLPNNAATSDILFLARIRNSSGTPLAGWGTTVLGSNVISFFSALGSSAAWTNSGTKQIQGELIIDVQ